jgi:aspartyl-tRNA(Asn)/glutamyl-tRNA(Gln) amidotransferase subunit B
VLLSIVKEVLAENPKALEDYKKGKKNAAKSILGGVMKKTAGRADPLLAQRLVDEVLGN